MAHRPAYSLACPTTSYPEQNVSSSPNNSHQSSTTTNAPYPPGTEMFYLSKTTFYQSATSAISFPGKSSNNPVLPNSPVYTGTAYPPSCGLPCHHLSASAAPADDPSMEYIRSPGLSGFTDPSQSGFVGPDSGVVAPPCGHAYPPPTGKVFPQYSAMHPPSKCAPLMAQAPSCCPNQAAWAFHGLQQQAPTESPCQHWKMPPGALPQPAAINSSRVSGQHSAVSEKKPHPRPASKQTPVRSSSTKALLSPMSPSSAIAMLQCGGRALSMAATGFRLIGKAKKYFSTREAEHEAEITGQQMAEDTWELSED